jgi:hypothetical protein
MGNLGAMRRSDETAGQGGGSKWGASGVAVLDGGPKPSSLILASCVIVVSYS